ncbi:MAG: CarD family transcriptional regulator [Hyphomicrobium sp.]
MTQKKKVQTASKASDKPLARKIAPVKAAAAPVKSVKTKPEVAQKATAGKAKAPAPVAAAKPVKKAPLPIKIEVKPAVASTAGLKKPVASLLKAAVAAAKPAAQAAAAAAVVHPQRAVPAAVQKPVGQRLTAPVAVPAASVQTPKAIAEKAAAARQILAAQKKPVSQRHGFKANEFIVYPAHGVGRIVGIEEQEIAGMSLELFVINFEKEKLTLRVPTGKLQSVGMRKLADDGVVKRAMEILKGRARIKRTMWSRRAQEYVAKINSGDLVSIAEVVRDLYRSEAQPEQSYSERQLYEDALDRMAREIAVVDKLDDRGAVQRITEVLSKSAKSRRLAGEAEAVGEAA